MARRGLWGEALFRFHEAEKADPENPRVHNNLGVAYEAQGDFEKALAHYKRALQLAPDNRQMRANYARFVEFYQAYKSPEKAKGKGFPMPKGAKGAAGSGSSAPGSSGHAPPAEPPPAPAGPSEPSHVPPGPAGTPGTGGTHVPPVQPPPPPPVDQPPPPPPPQQPPPAGQPGQLGPGVLS